MQILLYRRFSIILFLSLNLFSASTSSDSLNKHNLQNDFARLLKWEALDYVESYKSSWFQERVSTQLLEMVHHLVHPKTFFANRLNQHKRAVGLLASNFKEQENVNDVLKLPGALRNHPQVNPKVWLQSLVSAKAMRNDMQFLRIPSLVELVPDDFLPLEIFENASHLQQQDCLILDENFTSDNGIENSLWYLREDLSLNSHHYLWHVYYAGIGFDGSLEHADRRGELFYFMHHEFLSRYATERMTVGLHPIESLRIDRTTPLEGYFSHLTDRNSGNYWIDREHNMTLTDVGFQYLPGIWANISVSSNAELKDLLTADINTGFLIEANGTLISLDGFSGIDLISDTVEASEWAVNPERYTPDGYLRGFHNDGHSLISMISIPLIVDPADYTGAGVMAGTSTGMRDPIFYRFHSAVEDLFLEHKNLLTPYAPAENTDFLLNWDSIRITDVKLIPENQGAVNELKTFWNHKQFNFSRGLDFMKNENSPPVTVCAKHLDHKEFDYEINVESLSNTSEMQATVRIFIARRYDRNLDRFSMEDQRRLFFSLDQFSITLNPGTNRILRNSRNSTLTIPFESWVDLEDADTAFQNCGCGLPHHLLLPRGSATGTAYDVFVMLTPEKKEDHYNQANEEECQIAPLWCGVRNQNYPSDYPMGYPFDRRPYSITDDSGINRVVANLDEYIQGIPNMATTRVRIQHLENL